MNFIENETPQKLRGGYYTSLDIAQYLIRWISEIKPSRILEPSCGDGAFIRALAAARPRSLRELVGCEILGPEAEKSRAAVSALPRSVKTSIFDADFLGWALARLGTSPTFDAVIGNPPFIRYQYLNKFQQDRSQALFQQFDLPFTKHTNAWVPFIIASLAFLRPGGRLAMVVPAELLHVAHAQSLRSYLVRTCSRVLIIDPEELWFEGALQGVVLLLAERSTKDKNLKGLVAINRVRGRTFLKEPIEREFARASFVGSEELSGKWMAALLTGAERNLLRKLSARRSIRPFREIAHVAVGIVTGANKFFLVPDQTVRRFDLTKFAHPMFGRSEHVPGVIYDLRTHENNRRLGYPTNFLWFDSVAKSALPKGARAYIEHGEADALQARYKCRIRKPWYSVPSVFTAPVGMLKRAHDYPRLVLNTAQAYTTDTAYRISPTSTMSANQLVFTFVNSLTALSAELEGRHYGGGVLELVPSEINRVLIPYLPKVEPALKNLDDMFRNRVSAIDILAIQDGRVLRKLGLQRSECENILAAWLRLRSRRHRVEGSATDEVYGQTISMKNGELALAGGP